MADLIVLSLERWDDVWRRNQYLVDGLLRLDPDLRVLFVEPPDDPLHDVRSRRKPSMGARPAMIADRLWRFRPVKWLPRRVDPAADARMARATRQAAASLGMHDPVLWVNDPASIDLARQTGWPVLYDMTDDWTAADRPATERERIVGGERWLLENAATVVACSAELQRRKAAARPDVVLVRNGVDSARYLTPRQRPDDLPNVPYALYVGTLHRDRLDIDLVVQTAEQIGRRGHLVLVGPEAWDPGDAARVRAAGALVLGSRPRDDVPGYLQHADALIVPHVVDAFTESLDPLKLYEYQVVGRPVVSTPVAGFRDASRVTVAEGAAFASAVARALPASTSFPTDADGATADWSARVDEFYSALPRR